MDYKTIVVALDLHDDVQVVLHQAEFMAKQYNAALHVLHVLPNVYTSVPYAYDFQSEMEKEAELRLAKLKDEVSVDIVTHLVSGAPKREILNLVEEVNADLMIVGSHGKHGVELLLGSTANSVLHGAKCDVLTVRIDYSGRGEAHGPYRHLVVATDLRTDNQKVIHVAKSLKSKFEADMHLVHVVPDEATLASLYVPNVEEDIARQAEEDMQKMAADLGLASDDAKVLRGHPKSEILNYDKECGSDLLVIGSHGRALLEAALLGSTANAVLHGAEHDVLVVRL